MSKEKSCLYCFHKDVCYAMGRMPERAETCSKYAPDVKQNICGTWFITDCFDHTKTPIYQCSVCHKEVADNYIQLHKYCLHSGADMTKRED